MGPDCRHSKTTNGNCDSLAGVDRLTLSSVRLTLAGTQTKAGDSGVCRLAESSGRANEQLADSLKLSQSDCILRARVERR